MMLSEFEAITSTKMIETESQPLNPKPLNPKPCLGGLGSGHVGRIGLRIEVPVVLGIWGITGVDCAGQRPMP